MTNITIADAFKQIEQAGWFYKWLTETGYDYDGSCPCFSIENDFFSIDCSCWRSSGAGGFRYSGLRVVDKTDSIDISILNNFILLIISDIATVWKNTDWETQINDQDAQEYFIKE